MPKTNELAQFDELLSFHDKHECSYEQALEIVDKLQKANERLKTLARYWAVVKSGNTKKSHLQRVKKVTIAQADGSEFIVSEELRKIACLVNDLKVLVDEFPVTVQWLYDVNNVMRKATMSIHNLVSNSSVPLDYYMVLAEASAAHSIFQKSISSLRKAVNLLESLDLSSQILVNDILGPQFVPKLLQLASDQVECATDSAVQGISQVQFSKDRWKELPS